MADKNNIVGLNTEDNESDFIHTAADNLSRLMKFSYKDSVALLKEFYIIAMEIANKIEAAYVSENKNEIKILSHELKGVACNMRLYDIQQIATDIENKGICNPNEIIKLYNSIEKLQQ